MLYKQGIRRLAEALTTPLVCHPGGWGDSLPDWIKSAVLTERVEVALEEDPVATDAEVMAYLYTASLCFPLTSDWAQIYFYVAGRTMKRWKCLLMPEDIQVDKLSDYQSSLLARLRRDIYNSRLKALKKGGKKNVGKTG